LTNPRAKAVVAPDVDRRLVDVCDVLRLVSVRDVIEVLNARLTNRVSVVISLTLTLALARRKH
jgi:hypothetical protein